MRNAGFDHSSVLPTRGRAGLERPDPDTLPVAELLGALPAAAYIRRLRRFKLRVIFWLGFFALSINQEEPLALVRIDSRAARVGVTRDA